MRKKLFIAVAIFIASGTSFGQQGDGGAPKGTKLAPSELSPQAAFRNTSESRLCVLKGELDMGQTQTTMR